MGDLPLPRPSARRCALRSAARVRFSSQRRRWRAPLACVAAVTVAACSIDDRAVTLLEPVAGSGAVAAAGAGTDPPPDAAGAAGATSAPAEGGGGDGGGGDGPLGAGGMVSLPPAPDAGVAEPELPSCASRLLPGLATARATTTAAPGSASLTCGPGTSDDVSFYWVAPASGYYTFDTFGSSFDTVLGLLSPSCDGTELACNDESEAAPPASEIVREFEAGEAAVLVVDGKSGSFGEVTLRASAVTCPALDLNLQVPPITSTTLDGTAEHDGACGGSGPEKSFRYTAPSAGLYRFSVDAEELRPALYVERGPRCGGVLLGCNAAAPRSPASVVRRLDGGEVVTLTVDGAEGAGAFELDVEDISASPCPGRQLVGSVSDVLAPGDPSVLTASCGPARQSVLPGGEYDLPEHTYSLTTSAGSLCSLGVVADGPLHVYVLEGAACGGPELSCQQVPPTEESGVLLEVRLGDLFTGPFEYVVAVEAASPVSGPVSYTLDVLCAVI